MKRYEVKITGKEVEVYDNHLCKTYNGHIEEDGLHCLFPSTFENIMKAFKQENIDIKGLY